MKRSVTEAEAKAAGVFSGWTVEPAYGRFGTIATDAIQVVALPGGGPGGPVCFRFWRSRSGYRKACRMMRRSGHRIPQRPDQRDGRALFDDDAVRKPIA